VSDLFVDTTLTRDDLRRIAIQLANSPYSISELERIFIWEVTPACAPSQFAIAGEWPAFDPQWLESKILSGPSAPMWMLSFLFGRLSLLVSPQRRRLSRLVPEYRASSHSRAGA
jgi:hypothetical protein